MQTSYTRTEQNNYRTPIMHKNNFLAPLKDFFLKYLSDAPSG